MLIKPLIVRIRPFFIFLADTILLVLSFFAVMVFKQKDIVPTLEHYGVSFLIFMFIWIFSSLIVNKYKPREKESKLIKSLGKIFISSAIVLGVISTLMYLVRIWYYSRFVVFGTILLATIFEVIFSTLYYWIQTASKAEPEVLEKRPSSYPSARKYVERLISNKRDPANHLSDADIQKRCETIIHEIGQEAFDFIFNYVPIDSKKTFVLSTISHLNIELLSFKVIDTIVNLKRINDVRYINKFFEAVNEKLPMGGVLVDFLETKNQRKFRILNKFFFPLNYIYYFFDFIIKRVFPKFRLTKGIYFLLTRGENRVLTKAEAFGRLYSCGYDVIDELDTGGNLFFIALKVSKPLYPERPTYGPFIQLKRVGKNGKMIKVYKLRTMHPFSEFLQEYVYKKAGLQEGGKFKSDFRVSNLGKFFRMFWLDELPMFINLFKGDLKIVGVRPISKQYFNLYPKDMQERRIKYKPGLVPPFYVHNPKTLAEVIESEKKYLDEYDKKPFRTDIRYFFMAIYNIIFRRYRSA